MIFNKWFNKPEREKRRAEARQRRIEQEEEFLQKRRETSAALAMGTIFNLLRKSGWLVDDECRVNRDGSSWYGMATMPNGKRVSVLIKDVEDYDV